MLGSLEAVYHGASGLLTLKELVRSYVNLVEDSTRVMLRIKALFRSSGIKTPGRCGVPAVDEEELVVATRAARSAHQSRGAVRRTGRAAGAAAKVKAAMIAEARRQPGWKILRSVPFLGPVRVAEIRAIMATPWRFRTKTTSRHLALTRIP